MEITKRVRSRKQRDGSMRQQVRFVINGTHPRTGKRFQLFFDKQRDAIDKRNELIAAFERGDAMRPAKKALTVRECVEAWLENRKPLVRGVTFYAYEHRARHVIGPMWPSDARKATIKSGVGKRAQAEPMTLLRDAKVADLTPRDIRAWHAQISSEVSLYSANRAMGVLKAALTLAAEDYGFRPPVMPSGLARRKDKPKKAVLMPEQAAVLISAARSDDNALYCAALFLLGTRISEMLGLLWSEVDFEANVIQIKRIQDKRSGALQDVTKTAAGFRSIPMSATLRSLLLEWRVRCPRDEDNRLHRVFPGPDGGPLFYCHFRTRVWSSTLRRLKLPKVTPHSARATFISTLQAEGIPVADVARIAGHKSPAVTLGFYTHSMRDGGEAAKALDRALCVTE